MKKLPSKTKHKEVTIDNLAIMVAKGFDRMEDRFVNVEKEISDVKKDIADIKEDVKGVRRDILEVGDRFVPRYEFDGLLVRFNRLEQRVKTKMK